MIACELCRMPRLEEEERVAEVLNSRVIVCASAWRAACLRAFLERPFHDVYIVLSPPVQSASYFFSYGALELRRH